MAVRLIYETHSTLGERRQSDELAAVYVSDLQRAVETAQIAFSDRDTRIIQDARLRECNYGDLNGMPVADLTALRRSYIDTPFPGGQSYRDVVDATREFLSDIAAKHDGRTILVVAHSANRWALQYLLHGIPLEDLVDAPFAWQPGWEFMVKCDPLP